MKTRILTALLGIPLALWLVWVGGTAFWVASVIFALISMRELGVALNRSTSPSAAPITPALVYPPLLLLFLLSWGEFRPDNTSRWPPLLNVLPFALALALLCCAVLSYGNRRITLASIAMSLLCLLYVGLWVFMPLLRERPGGFAASLMGRDLFLLTIIGVWTGDTVAYFAGRAWGNTKLTPLSPGKTQEGAVIGLLVTIIVCRLMAPQLNLEDGFALGLIIGVLSPLGDLAESFWKRELGVKDLGTLLPGHGGVLDRCDSLLFAVFGVYAWTLLANL